MKLITCGSRLDIPDNVIQSFDGLFGGYFWNPVEKPRLKDYVEKYQKTETWSNFLYGNSHKIPNISSGVTTIEDWIIKRINLASYVNNWVLINEFTDNKGIPYSGYEYEKIKKYLEVAHGVNPEAKLIIADFRPHLLGKWSNIKTIVERLLSDDVPIHGVSVQVHFKTRNAHSKIPGVPYILDALPTVIRMFNGVCPVHLTEVSGWRHYSEKPEILTPLWNEVIKIAKDNNVETFCPWWLNEYDEAFPRAMPTFEEFIGAGIYDKDWNQRLILPGI